MFVLTLRGGTEYQEYMMYTPDNTDDNIGMYATTDYIHELIEITR